MKKIIAILYIVVVVVMATATIVEQYKGTEYADATIYGAWWFSALWALLAAATIFYFIKQKVRRPSVVVLHFSFVVILAGALLTHLTAKRGFIVLRKGQPTSEYLTRDMYRHPLPFSITLDDFRIKYYEGSNEPSDYVSQITIGEHHFTISMNNIATYKGIRLYQSDYDDDMQGSILAMNSDPWGIPVTYCGYALLFVSLLWMLIDPRGGFRQKLSELRKHRFPLAIFAVFLLACFVLLVIHFMGKYSASNHPLPVLNSKLLPIHVSTIMMAYTLFLLTFIVSLIALALPKKRDKLRVLSQVMLYPALSLLGYGIFIGAIWANISWGTYWSWDPKETWALITLMIYAVPAHRSIRLNYHLYMTLSLVSILMTWFGVNFLLGGMHSYA